ncbi:MAG: hypothetical protein GY838_01090 [bacterium]|nr:hypothetical protein [bacterium]
MGRQILAVVAGFFAWTVIWLVAGQVVAAVAPDAFAEDGLTVVSSGILVLFLLVAAVACVVAGWLAALVGRERARRAVMILALVLLVVGLGVELSTWGAAPAWYHLIFLGLLVPLTVAGGNLKRLPA